MKDQQYYFHQTPAELALKLVDFLPITMEDTAYEPMKGEGAFYNALRQKTKQVDWAEIEEGKDYLDNNNKYDYICTNPPFQERGSFWKILSKLIDQTNKCLAVLGNSWCMSAITPRRLKWLEGKGFYLTSIVICNVAKWKNRYYFMIFTRDKNESFKYLEGNY